MATFTVTTTPTQDRAIAYFVAQGQAANADALVQAATGQALTNLIDRFRESDDRAVATALQKADAATVAQVKTLLGL